MVFFQSIKVLANYIKRLFYYQLTSPAGGRMIPRTGMSRFIPESGNLPHIRILYYIHRKDGKGPEKHFIS